MAVVFQFDQGKTATYLPTYLGETHPSLKDNTHDAFHCTALRSFSYSIS